MNSMTRPVSYGAENDICRHGLVIKIPFQRLNSMFSTVAIKNHVIREARGQHLGQNPRKCQGIFAVPKVVTRSTWRFVALPFISLFVSDGDCRGIVDMCVMYCCWFCVWSIVSVHTCSLEFNDLNFHPCCPSAENFLIFFSSVVVSCSLVNKTDKSRVAILPWKSLKKIPIIPGPGKSLKTEQGLESFGIWRKRSFNVLEFQYFIIVITTMWKTEKTTT